MAERDEWTGAVEDVRRLMRLGVADYQVDSIYEPLFQRRNHEGGPQLAAPSIPWAIRVRIGSPFTGGAAPLGYAKDLRGGLAVNQSEAATIQQFVDLRRRRLSLHAIANVLNVEGHASKRGDRFYASTISYILDNPNYRGLIEYYFRHDGEVHCLGPGFHEAMLPKAA